MIRLMLVSSFFVCSLGAVPRIRIPKLEGRIIGGTDGYIEDYPYQLGFEYYGNFMCGASIISENYIVTAAHCTYDVSADYVQFRAGSSIRGSGGSVHQAQSLLAHPDFNYYNVDCDIAVGKVATPFSFGSGVQPIPLATSEPAAGTDVVVSGWGLTASGEISTKLQVVTIPIVDHLKCNESYASYGGITDNMICAGLEEGGKGSCQLDSGGPLVADGQLAGIVSFGAGCAEAGYPGVYANVVALKSFVDENTQ